MCANGCPKDCTNCVRQEKKALLIAMKHLRDEWAKASTYESLLANCDDTHSAIEHGSASSVYKECGIKIAHLISCWDEA